MFRKLKDFYNRFSIPEENKYDSYALSITKLNVIFKALTVFCLFETILTIFSPTMEQEMGGNIRIYYMLFGVFMLLGWITTDFWKKFKGINLNRDKKVAKTILILTALFFGLLTVYEAMTFDSIHNVIAICVIIAIVVLFLVELNPIMYTGIFFVLITINIPVLYSVYNNVSMIVNSYLFLITIGFASYSFMTKELAKLEYLKELKAYTQEIENKVIEETNKRTQLQDDIIYSMADLVENRDIDTGAHIKRTAFFVEVIAKKARDLGYYTEEIDDEFIDYLKKAMPLHDIGKIVIPDAILKVPRKLTMEEFDIMKTHTVKGEEIVKNIFFNLESEEYLEYASLIAKYHHEWWNGKGYPERLRKKEIPLCARIAAVADVFDALVSKRCYKEAFDINEAFKMMEEEKGTHFDPLLLDAFMKSKSEIIKIVEILT